MTSTASNTSKADLLDFVIAAYGDLDRWRSLEQLTANVSDGGALWGIKGQPGILEDIALSYGAHPSQPKGGLACRRIALFR